MKYDRIPNPNSLEYEQTEGNWIPLNHPEEENTSNTDETPVVAEQENVEESKEAETTQDEKKEEPAEEVKVEENKEEAPAEEAEKKTDEQS